MAIRTVAAILPFPEKQTGISFAKRLFSSQAMVLRQGPVAAKCSAPINPESSGSGNTVSSRGGSYFVAFALISTFNAEPLIVPSAVSLKTTFPAEGNFTVELHGVLVVPRVVVAFAVPLKVSVVGVDHFQVPVPIMPTLETNDGLVVSLTFLSAVSVRTVPPDAIFTEFWPITNLTGVMLAEFMNDPAREVAIPAVEV